MRYSCQCFYCGEFVLLVSPQIFAGHYACPVCDDGTLFVPETDLTPVDPDGLNLCVFEVLRVEDSDLPRAPDSSLNT